MKMGRIDVYRKMVVGSVNGRSSTAQLIFSGSRRGGGRRERKGPASLAVAQNYG